jgi:hypothetical protein
MLKTRLVLTILAAGVSLLGDDKPSQADAWKKPFPEWTMDDAHQIMTDSPWVKSTTPTMEGSGNQGQRRSGGGGGGRRGGGIGIGGGGIGIGIPGIGGRGGGGYPGGGGGGYPGGSRTGTNYPDDSGNGNGRTDPVEPPKLTLRWESAMPVREAELRARDVDAPTVDENHYAIAVIGVPRNMIKADTRAMEADLKKQAVLKRDNKKDFKPSSVEILQRDDGPVIVFFFPRSTEITASDRRVEFDAEIGRLKFAEPFYLEDMVYDGKLAL